MIVKKIEMADKKGKDKILNKEIPARMGAMSVLKNTFLPYDIAVVEKEIN